MKKVHIYFQETGKIKLVDRITMDEREWKTCLSPEQFKVMRKKGTERPFTGALLKNKENGVYKCASCGTDLFSSRAKFDSGTGWPSFWEPLSETNVQYREDNGLFKSRTEVLCARCGAHLGHVFQDGPLPTGKRYCINSAALEFEKEE